MMESKHDYGSNKQAAIIEGNIESSELHPEAKHDDNKPTTEGVVSGLEVYPGAKHDDIKPTKEGTVSGLDVLAETMHGDNKPTEEGTVSGLEPLPEAKHDDHEAIIEGKNKGSSSSSSSLSSSLSSTSSGDPLELISGEDDPLDDSFIKSDLPQSPRSECTSPPDVSAQTPQWSMISASPRAGPGNSFSRELLPPTPEWSMSNSSPLKSPVPQIMGRQTGYDPNRIPSSIFSTRPTTPMEWSVASNESLFSIHMGNSSFSRENVFMLGDSKPEEWTNSSSHMHHVSEAKSESNFITNLPPVFEAASENDKKSADIREESSEEESQKPPKIVSGKTGEQCEKDKLAAGAQEACMSTTSSNLSEGKGVTPVHGKHSSVSAPRVSDESGNSSGSFAFPVLDTNEGGKSASLKAIAEKPEEPQSEPQDPQPPPKAAWTSWFSCFSCCPRCC